MISRTRRIRIWAKNTTFLKKIKTGGGDPLRTRLGLQIFILQKCDDKQREKTVDEGTAMLFSGYFAPSGRAVSGLTPLEPNTHERGRHRQVL